VKREDDESGNERIAFGVLAFTLFGGLSGAVTYFLAQHVFGASELISFFAAVGAGVSTGTTAASTNIGRRCSAIVVGALGFLGWWS
jgi:hypothetical protein